MDYFQDIFIPLSRYDKETHKVLDNVWVIGIIIKYAFEYFQYWFETL